MKKGALMSKKNAAPQSCRKHNEVYPRRKFQGKILRRNHCDYARRNYENLEKKGGQYTTKEHSTERQYISTASPSDSEDSSRMTKYVVYYIQTAPIKFIISHNYFVALGTEG
jgi:hypothetical protein